MLVVIGVSIISVLVIVVGVVISTFFHRCENVSYNPCFFNFNKDEYAQFIITGVFHTAGVAILTILQLVSEYFPNRVALHLNGSLQILSLITGLLYYHVLVINYKHRYLEVCHRGYGENEPVIALEIITASGYFLITMYAAILFQAECYHPEGIFSKPGIDPISGWDLENYSMILIFVIITSASLLATDFIRIMRNAFKVYLSENEPDGTTHYYFRKHIAQTVQPHVINDTITLFIPILYLIVRSSPIMHINEYDLAAKCLLILHPAMFTVIYMEQIKKATQNARKEELECRCHICQRKKERRRAKNDSTCISLAVMGSASRNCEERKMEERTADEQPTETTSALCPSQIES